MLIFIDTNGEEHHLLRAWIMGAGTPSELEAPQDNVEKFLSKIMGLKHKGIVFETTRDDFVFLEQVVLVRLGR